MTSVSATAYIYLKPFWFEKISNWTNIDFYRECIILSTLEISNHPEFGIRRHR